MTPISPHCGLLRYVRQQEGGAPPSCGVRTRLWPAAHMAEKIKFKIWHLFILVPKFHCFYIKPNVYVT